MVYSEHDIDEKSLENVQISNQNRYLSDEYHKIVGDFVEHMNSL